MHILCPLRCDIPSSPNMRILYQKCILSPQSQDFPCIYLIRHNLECVKQCKTLLLLPSLSPSSAPLSSATIDYVGVVDAQVAQSSLRNNKAANGAGISVQQVTSMSLYNVSIVVRLMPYEYVPRCLSPCLCLSICLSVCLSIPLSVYI